MNFCINYVVLICSSYTLAIYLILYYYDVIVGYGGGTAEVGIVSISTLTLSVCSQ